MKWFLKAVVALSLLAVCGGFAIFQLASNIVPPLPPSVTTIPIDGGPNYMANHGFTSATSSVTFNGPTCTNSCTFANGWDSANWFMYATFLGSLTNSTDVTLWKSVGFNTAFSFMAPFSGQEALASAAGIQNIVSAQELNHFIVNDPPLTAPGLYLWDEPQYAEIYTAQVQGYSSTTFTGSVTSNTLTVSTVPAGGVPILVGVGLSGGITGSCQNNSAVNIACMVNTGYLSGTGIAANTYFVQQGISGRGSTGTYAVVGNNSAPALTVGSETITQIAYPGYDAATQDTRFSAMGLAGLTFLGQENITAASGSISATAFYAQTVTAPSGKTRHLDMTVSDIFYITIGHSQGIQPYNQSISNFYDKTTNSRPLTQLEASIGAHYGDTIDIQRNFVGTVGGAEPNGIKIAALVETGDCRCNLVNYTIQPVEMAWAAWAQIIHGAQGMAWFDFSNFGSNISNCGPVNIECAYYQSAQSASFTGSISGNTLTVTTAPTGSPGPSEAGAGLLAPGMVATSGVTGTQSIIAAQTVVGPTAGATFTATFSGGSNTIMTVSGISGTLTIPSIIAGNCNPGSFGQCLDNTGMAITVTADTGGGGGNGTYTVTANSVAGGAHASITSQPVATANAVFSGTNQTTMTLTSVAGTIIVPSTVIGQGVNGTAVRTVVTPGSVYTVDPNFGSASSTLVRIVPTYGGIGQYKVTGGTAASPVSMTYQQQYGRGNNSPAAISMTGTLTELANEFKDMAAVINSPFAKGYVSTSPVGYRFEDGMTQQPSGAAIALKSFTWSTTPGIETMAKYYTGSSYTANSGETIAPGFYVFAGTRYSSDTLGTTIGTVTYTLGTSGCNNASVATVIGESRTRPISACTFTDTFNNAWTYHIYKIQ